MRSYFAWFVLWLFAAPWLSLTAWADTAPADFTLDIQIDPAAHELAVQAEIILPDDYAGKTFEFLLTNAVEVIKSEPAVQKIPTNASKGFIGINGSSMGMSENGHIARYRVQLPPGSSTLNIKYRGVVNFVLGDMKEQYTRGFRSTAGLIDNEGIFLAGSSMWYPYFGDELINFTLKSNVPKGWHLISQGNGSSRDEQGVAHWESGGAVDEIYLVGGPLVRYSEQSGTVTSVAYLHEADDALAQRYLTATAQYIQMYQNLVGPYPYKKFALVENFWETGYGMPSFTLLGPQIIRFPFILTSSYPHEILHNWWGNSVYVDYATGNWAEGLTSYMADHLIQEQNGKGAAYRRDTLKKYRDFVKEDRDFPLSDFRSRHSAATAAVGYGKTLMGFHMLRRKLGDEAFMHGISHFYKSNVGKKASFADIRAELEANSKQDLGTFFKQWVEWTGAIDLNVRDVKVQQSGNQYTISGKLVQVQTGKTYQLDVPVNVTTVNGLEQSTISLTGKSTAFTLSTTAKPLLLEVDPEFDLFRLLDPRETAPSIGQIFGEQEIIAVMPTGGDPKRLAAYRQLAEDWRTESHLITIVSDTDIDTVPANKAAWFFGADNRLAQRLFGSDPALKFTQTAIVPQGQAIPKQDHSSVLIKRHPANTNKAIGWIVVDPIEAFPGIGRKLPHYSKYSFLGFAGQEPSNMVKGEWIATDSPLRVDLRAKSDQMGEPVPAAMPPTRKALTEIPVIPSRESLLEHTSYLASEELGGRGLGTPGLEKAATYIAEQFKAFGLTPAGDNDKYLQSFRIEKGEDGKPHKVANVVGVIQGSNSDFDGQAVLVVAHYDHLGHGGGRARAEEEGKIHFGADDNASGVAVLLELARMFSEGATPQRSIVFVAFTGEESGLLGSKYYTDNPTAVKLSNIMGVINLDTVGRLGDKDISVFGADSASEWQHIFRGIDFTIGIKSKLIMGPFASSDHQAFLDKGVPAVHISSGANLDYHRPTDTVEKIDSMGMVNITTFSQLAINYLAERPKRLTATITKKAPPPPPAAGVKKGSRVSLGTVPDFAFQGPGLRAEMVVPGSAAAEAGMQAGDILISLDGKSIANLQGFSDLLKTLSPGKTVPAIVDRDGQRIKMDIKLRAR